MLMPAYDRNYLELMYQLCNFDTCFFTYDIINQDKKEQKLFRT